MEEDVVIKTADGVSISLSRFKPAGETSGNIIIAAAMGVPQKFYRDLARWLAQSGYSVVTFDYRGMGRSAPPNLNGYQADIRDWAELDCAAVIDYVHEQNNSLPLYWIGHSLGGQIIGLIPNCHRINKAITIASGNGYWRYTVRKSASLWMWYIIVPVLSLFCGHFPGRKLGIVGDLPMGVIHQWRQWCLSERYLLDNVEESIRERYDKVQFPITFYALADDEMLSYRAIKSVHGFYPSSPRQLHLLQPSDFDVKRIGHFGFFRQQFADRLWESLLKSELSV